MKISLSQMRKLDTFEEVESPEIVYHMTSRENAKSIINDRKVKCFDDYVTWFFTDLHQVPVYIYITDADYGRRHYDTNGWPVTEPPLDHADAVILKLSCRKEPLAWYREVINSSKDGCHEMTALQDQLWAYMNDMRLCHYGDLHFYKVIEIIELTDIDKLPQPDEIEEIKAIQEKMAKEIAS